MNGMKDHTKRPRTVLMLLLVLWIAGSFVGCGWLGGKQNAGASGTVHGGYNEHDYDALAAFLEQKGDDGVKNGEKICRDYSVNDPSSWQGVEWTDTPEGKRVYRADVSGTEGDLDLSGCTALTMLISVGGLKSLDLSGCTSLTGVDCSNNRLTSLTLTGCRALAALHCEYNDLAILDLTGLSSLTTLRCEYNRISSIDLTGCSALEYMDCRKNALTAVELSDCRALRYLDCGYNAFTSLTLDLPALAELRCEENMLAELDVSRCPALDALTCRGNRLTVIDVSACGKSIRVDCDEGVTVSR